MSDASGRVTLTRKLFHNWCCLAQASLLSYAAKEIVWQGMLLFSPPEIPKKQEEEELTPEPEVRNPLEDCEI